MKLFRLFSAASGLGLLTIGLGGCLPEPTYPATPEISFSSISLKHVTGSTQAIDSVFITIRFQDGDGDLGLSSDESSKAPYAYPSRFNNNYFIEPYVKQPNGTFVSLADPSVNRTTTGAYNSRFEHIATSTDSRSAPIKGTLTRRYGFAYKSLYQPGEVAQFRVSIADRAMHESNVITTDPITFPN